MKLRTHLFILVIAALVPALIFSCVMIFVSYRQQRAEIERGMIDTARALSLAVDRELESAIRTLSAIAASEHLTAGNLRQFYLYAQDAIQVSRGWEGVALLDSAGQQLLNLRRPFGAKLPRSPVPDVIRRVVETREPTVSGLYRSPTRGDLLFFVAVPVVRNGEVRYVLASAASPAFLATLLLQQKIPPRWTGTILDQNKIIIARTREADKLVGQPATPQLAAESVRAEEGWFQGITKENIPVYDAFSRSRLSGWTVGLGNPSADVEGQLRHSLILTGIGGLLLLLGGILVATTVGRRISRSAARLSAGAQGMGKGETPRFKHLPIVELDEVAREIEMAAVNRNEMEAALRQSEGRLKSIIETEPECVKIIAPDGRLLEMNPAGLAMLEAASLEEVKARPLLEFIAAEYRSAFGGLHERVMEGESGTLEFEIVGFKGTRRWLDTHATPLRDETGKPAALLGITRDITQRKLAEEKERNNLERLRALHEIDLAITSTLDLRTVLDVLLEKIDPCFSYRVISLIRLLNREGQGEPVAARNLEIDRIRAGSGAGLARRVLESKIPLVVRNLQTDPRVNNPEAFRDRGLVSYVGVPLIVKDKVMGLLSLYTREEHEFTDEEIEFITTLADQAAIAIHNAQLHEEIKGQAAVLEKANADLTRREQVERLLKELSQDIVSLDADSLLDKLTARVREVFEVDVCDVRLLVDRDRWRLGGVSGLDPNRFASSRDGAAFGRMRWIIENRKPLIIPDSAQGASLPPGDTVTSLGLRGYLGVPLLSRSGEILGVLRALTYQPRNFSQEEVDLLQQLANGAAAALDNARLYDQTKNQALELGRANKIKDEFLSVMSHELRTPLSAIAGYVGIMKDRLLGEINQRQEDSLQKVLSRAADQLAMINDIMQTTQLEARAATVERHSIDLKTVIQNLQSDYELTLPRKKIAVTWDYPSGPLAIVTDGGKIRQILQNLINNAIKFTDEGSVAVSVRVTGIGNRGLEISPDPRLPTPNSQSLNPNSHFVQFVVADTGAGIPKDKLARIFEKFFQVDSSETRFYGGVGLGLYIVKNFTDLLGGTVEVESEPGKGSTFTVRIPA
jgi:PAS domain S-box-containing protein